MGAILLAVLLTGAASTAIPHKINDPARGMVNFPCTLTIEGC